MHWMGPFIGTAFGDFIILCTLFFVPGGQVLRPTVYCVPNSLCDRLRPGPRARVYHNYFFLNIYT